MLLRIQQITGGAQQTLASVGVFPAAEIGVRPAAAMLLTVAMAMVVGE